MKPTYLTALLFIFAAAGFAQPKKSHLQSINIFGPVKSYTETKYTAAEQFGDIEKRERKETRTEVYDRAGYCISVKKEGKDQLWDYLTVSSYNDDNKPLEQKITMGKDVQTTQYKYDARGKEEEINVYFNGPLYSRQKNRPVEGIVSVKGKEYRNAVKESLYNGNGELIQETIRLDSTYSTMKDLVKKKTDTVYLMFDKQGNMIRSLSVTEKDSTIYQYQYDQMNRMIKKDIWLSMLPVTNITTYTYNQYGHLQSEKKDERTTSYSYTYDARNNWLKRVKKVEDRGRVDFEIAERELTYY